MYTEFVNWFLCLREKGRNSAVNVLTFLSGLSSQGKTVFSYSIAPVLLDIATELPIPCFSYKNLVQMSYSDLKNDLIGFMKRSED
jgi:hypothetical protein